MALKQLGERGMHYDTMRKGDAFAEGQSLMYTANRLVEYKAFCKPADHAVILNILRITLDEALRSLSVNSVSIPI